MESGNASSYYDECGQIMNGPQLKGHIYSTSPESSLFIGKRSLGHVSNYYLGEVIDDGEVAFVQAAAEKLEVDVLNTR